MHVFTRERFNTETRVMEVTFLIWMLFKSSEAVDTNSGSPSTLSRCYGTHGDITVALLLGFRSPTSNGSCSPEIFTASPTWIDCAQNFVSQIAEINKRQDLLPNVTVGHFVMETCFTDPYLLAYSAVVLPRISNPWNYSIKVSEDEATCRQSFQNLYTTPFGWIRPMVSNTIEIVQPNNIGLTPTLPEVDSESQVITQGEPVPHLPYDDVLLEAIFAVLDTLNWTKAFLYVPSGQSGNITEWIEDDRKGLCVVLVKVQPVVNNEFLNQLMNESSKFAGIKTAISLLSPVQENALVSVIESWNRPDIIWIGGKGLLSSPTLTSIIFQREYINISERSKTVISNAIGDKIPWSKYNFESIQRCVWTTKYPSPLCKRSRLITENKVEECDLYSTHVMGSVMAYTDSLHKVLSRHCPAAFNDTNKVPDKVQHCLRNNDYQAKLKSTVDSFSAQHLNPNLLGDKLVKYNIFIYKKNDERSIFVGTYNSFSKRLEISVATIVSQTGTLKLEESWAMHFSGEQCDMQCPRNTSGKNVQICLLCMASNCSTPTIIPYKEPPDILSVGLLAVSSCGLTLSIIAFIWLFNKRYTKLIQNSSPILLGVSILGMAVEFSVSLVLVLTLSSLTCTVQVIGHGMSILLVTSPLTLTSLNACVRTIYSTTGKNPSCFCRSMPSIAVLIICLVQGVVVTYIILFPNSLPEYAEAVTGTRGLGFPTRPLPCQLTIPNLLLPLCANVCLTMIGLTCGFLTRDRSENYFESRQVMLASFSSLLIWIALAVAILVVGVNDSLWRMVILVSCCMTVAALTFIWVLAPKIYAVHCIDESYLEVWLNHTTVVPSNGNNVIRTVTSLS